MAEAASMFGTDSLNTAIGRIISRLKILDAQDEFQARF